MGQIRLRKSITYKSILSLSLSLSLISVTAAHHVEGFLQNVNGWFSDWGDQLGETVVAHPTFKTLSRRRTLFHHWRESSENLTDQCTALIRFLWWPWGSKGQYTIGHGQKVILGTPTWAASSLTSVSDSQIFSKQPRSTNSSYRMKSCDIYKHHVTFTW